MLKNLLKLTDAQKLSKNEQEKINGGGFFPSACTFPGAPPNQGPCVCIINGEACRVERDYRCLDGTDPICPNF